MILDNKIFEKKFLKFFLEFFLLVVIATRLFCMESKSLNNRLKKRIVQTHIDPVCSGELKRYHELVCCV